MKMTKRGAARKSMVNSSSPALPRAALTSRLFCFFALVFAGAWLPWWAVALDPRLPTKLALVGMIAPAAAAFLVAAMFGGRHEVAIIASRLIRLSFGARWWLLALTALPIIYAIAALATGGRRLHLLVGPQSWWFLPLSFTYLVIITAGEEIGWRGYALPLLLKRGVPPIIAGIGLGLVWGVWHIPLRASSGQQFPLPLFLLFTVALSLFYMIVQHRAGGSLVPALLIHASTDIAPRIIDLTSLRASFWALSDALIFILAGVLCLVSGSEFWRRPPSPAVVPVAR